MRPHSPAEYLYTYVFIFIIVLLISGFEKKGMYFALRNVENLFNIPVMEFQRLS